MAKRDRDYENRMARYIAAYNIVKAEGIEGLEKELRMRNVLKVDIKVPGKVMMENFEEVSKNLYNNTMTAVAWTLHDIYGFGRKRIKEFKENFDKTVQHILDLYYLGGITSNLRTLPKN